MAQTTFHFFQPIDNRCNDIHIWRKQLVWRHDCPLPDCIRHTYMPQTTCECKVTHYFALYTAHIICRKQLIQPKCMCHNNICRFQSEKNPLAKGVQPPR